MACQSEIQQDQPTRAIDEHVIRLDVAMNELVSVEPAKYARKVAKRIAEAPEIAFFSAPHVPKKGRSGHQFHGEEPEVTVFE